MNRIAAKYNNDMGVYIAKRLWPELLIHPRGSFLDRQGADASDGDVLDDAWSWVVPACGPGPVSAPPSSADSLPDSPSVSSVSILAIAEAQRPLVQTSCTES
ncbi:MAG: hypothetical protein ACOC6S_03330 [Chloroflexota bacterium]